MSPSRHKTVEDFLRQIVETGTSKVLLSAEADADGNLAVSISTPDGTDVRDFRALGHTLRPV